MGFGQLLAYGLYMQITITLVIIILVWSQYYSVLKKRGISLDKIKQFGIVIVGCVVGWSIFALINTFITLPSEYLNLLVIPFIFTMLFIYTDKFIEEGSIEFFKDILMSSIGATIYIVLAVVVITQLYARLMFGMF